MYCDTHVYTVCWLGGFGLSLPPALLHMYGSIAYVMYKVYTHNYCSHCMLQPVCIIAVSYSHMYMCGAVCVPLLGRCVSWVRAVCGAPADTELVLVVGTSALYT